MEASRCGISLMPVIWPGSSTHNEHPYDPRYTLNQFIRDGGKFYWRQAFNTISAPGVKTLFVAMFDEVDEGTAMFKMVSKAEQLPVGAELVHLNIDGYNLPSDWYLTLGGYTCKMLRGEISRNVSLNPPR